MLSQGEAEGSPCEKGRATECGRVTHSGLSQIMRLTEVEWISKDSEALIQNYKMTQMTK
jgi:hypothetical protein